ncbi:MAG: ABC transporter permease, partial [Candidatus Pacearchaeota archaeon]|nr:ABC transporter permease [Candidatus Pacearchaeota archaeon]
MSLGDGLRTAINGQFGGLNVDTLTIQNKGTGFGPPGSTSIEKLTEHDVEIIQSVSGVKIVVPRLIRIAKIQYNKIDSFNYLASIPKTKEQIEVVQELLPKLEAGRYLKPDDKGKVVLGSEFSVGKQFEKYFEKEIRVGSNIMIQGKEFEVVGILKQASTFVINMAVMMPEEEMKNLLGIGDKIDIIATRVDQSKIEEIAKNIEDKLRRDRKEKVGEETFDVQTPLQVIQSASTILNIVNLIVTGIAAISLLIGGLGIANTMYTSVLERTREIGTMKAIGA